MYKHSMLCTCNLECTILRLTIVLYDSPAWSPMPRKKGRFVGGSLTLFLRIMFFYLLVCFDLYASHGKQAVGNSVVTVGYVMKPSREEDFAKVSPLINWKQSMVMEKQKFKKR